jgi:hypothetical protein
MAKRKSQIPPALKHGVYSLLGLLPGEDPAAFEKFRCEIFAEYNFTGRSEEAIGDNLVRCMWRGENLSTYRLAEYAKEKYSRIYAKTHPPALEMPVLDYWAKETRSQEELEEARKQANEEAEHELGPALELVEAGEVVTTEYLLDVLSTRERLDQAIARLLKELVLVRGVKSLSSPSAGTVSTRRLPKAA